MNPWDWFPVLVVAVLVDRYLDWRDGATARSAEAYLRGVRRRQMLERRP